MRKRQTLKGDVEQLSLWADEQVLDVCPAKEERRPAKESEKGAVSIGERTPIGPVSDADLERLIVYSSATTTYHGVHDQMRREWLRAWGKAHNYPRDWFTIQTKSGGYYQAAIPAGKQAWELFLEQAQAFDVYCSFVEGYAATKLDSIKEMGEFLPRLLNEASKRGELKLEDIKWTGYRAMEYQTAKDYEPMHKENR